MPNIAFLSLTYLIFAVPGFIYRWLYLSGEFTRQLLNRSWTDEIGKAILYAIPFHALWILIFEQFQHSQIFNYTVNFVTAFRLLIGDYKDGKELVEALYHNVGYVSVYYSLVVTSAIGTAILARKIVWGFELDTWPKLGFLRYRNVWLYIIMGRGKLKGVPQKQTVAMIDVLTDQEAGIPGKMVLYRGRAAAFETNEDGSLRDIHLTEVMRGGFGPKTVWGRQEFMWRLVPGNVFVLDYSRVRNINITYVEKSHYDAAVSEAVSLPLVPSPDLKSNQASLPSQASEGPSGSTAAS